MGLLQSIRVPTDVRRLSMDELATLANEIRERVVQSVSTNGGHLASNLGVAELTIALHYVYDFGPFPTGPDWLLWDVGHQCYPHKMLTGRTEMFPTLRKKGSVGGFPSPVESPYDLFSVGHAGTAISTAVGMARGDELQNKKSNVVAVVGDASIVNGLAFEGLNNAGTLKRQMLVILNDNGMSISQPQGAFSQYLERVRVSTTYGEAKKLAEKFVGRLPTGVGHTVEQVWRHVSEGVKSAIWPGQIFETLGIKYMGPISGHDIPEMINMLAEIKHVDAPMLLHVKTVKGNGYEVAINEPTRFHSPAAFRVNGCQVEISKGPGKSWTTAYADAMIDLARQDSRVVALTAAMPDGTGLSKFEKEIPGRYFDTGICESHLAAMAAGMAKTGMRPFAAIYSTFAQRAFDQFWQEVSLNHLPVVLCMDRAGFVGDDGAVHHGFMDQAFLRPLPGIVLMAPSDEADLNRSLRFANTLDNVSAIRYPRDNVPTKNFEECIEENLRGEAGDEWQLGRSRVLREGSDATIIAYGALALNVMTAAEDLAADGIQVEIIDARFCKPVDGRMLGRVLRDGHPVLTVEDHSLQNGFGTAVLEHAASHGLTTLHVTRLGIPDRLISHATRNQQLTEVGLDPAGIAQSIRDAIRAVASPQREPSVVASI
ncbi:MAG: 1-deoxy-D-xylulose-5-phosphate synthase [Planctomycetota bacterium]|nr:1-deoxy-D-xylulose-5-phosphate synthase [Planctomycetota bacterium]